MNQQNQNHYGQEAAAKAQQLYASGAIASLQNCPVQPPQATRFSSCAGRLESQVNHLFSCIERASRVADRLGGAIPVDPQKAERIGNGGNVASQIEEQNERFDTALKSLMNALERLEQL